MFGSESCSGFIVFFYAKISATVGQFSLFKVAKYNETDFPRRFFLDLIAKQFPPILTTACYFANYINGNKSNKKRQINVR